MQMKRPAILLLLILLAPSLVPISNGQPDPQWTVMVYLDADNNLEEFGIGDFVEMATVGSTPNVNVVVQFDRSAGNDQSYGDWTDAKRFYVTQGMTPIEANQVSTLGEVNMADPQTLTDFLNWSVANYPAEKYILVLWDHGAGWEGIISDDSGGGLMDTPGLRSALAAFTALQGVRLDIVAFDACRMMLETVYELRSVADYFVGSQMDVPDRGFPYERLLKNLTSNPWMAPGTAAEVLVDCYVDFYTNNTAYAVTLTSIPADSLDGLVAGLGEFLNEAFLELPLYSGEVMAARDATDTYGGDSQYDLHHFMENLRARVPSRALAELAGSVMSAIDSSVYLRKWDKPGAVTRATNAHGFTIWLPTSLTDPAYLDMAFANDSLWDEFLGLYGQVIPRPQVSLEVDHTETDTDGNGYNDTVVVSILAGASERVSVDIYDRGKKSSREYNLSANVPFSDTYALTDNLLCSLHFYLRNSTGHLLNYTEFNVSKLFKVRGTIRDEGKALLTGLSLTNLDTGQSLTTLNRASGFEFRVLHPSWAGDDDVLRLSFEHEGETLTYDIVPEFSMSTYTLDIALEHKPDDDRPGGYDLSILFMALHVVAVLLIIANLKRLKSW